MTENIIPYSFVPGTKAKAQEVNANFIALAENMTTISANKLNKDLSNITEAGVDVIKNSVSSRNIGELIYSLIPLTDSGLHLMDGSLISGEGVYSDFVELISSLSTNTDYSNIFTTEALWQNTVSTYGSCGKFVYDVIENTVRLPKICNILEGTTDLTALGDLVEAGLPNITGTISIFAGGGGSNGALSMTATNRTNNPGSGNMLGNNNFSIDASNSSSIYGNSTTVQPQTIKSFIYIVIANTAKTDIQIDIDEVATDLNNKCDVDLNNINASQSAKNTIVNWGMPDYSSGITFTWGTDFTAPSDGFVWMTRNVHSAYGYWSINNGTEYPFGGNSEGSGTVTLLISKGDILKTRGGNNDNNDKRIFFPLKGVN